MCPIYDFSRKCGAFIWRDLHQNAFKEIEKRLLKPSVLHLPDNRGCFQLYSEESHTVAGGALHQIKSDKTKIIAYASKSLPAAVVNSSIMDLTLLALAVNFASFKHLFTKVDFKCIVDHLALVHIMKSKSESPNTTVKRALEILCAYSFNLHYIKGKVMTLSNFLSRIDVDNAESGEIIPIYFSVLKILMKNTVLKQELNLQLMVLNLIKYMGLIRNYVTINGLKNRVNPRLYHQDNHLMLLINLLLRLQNKV